MRKKTRSVGEPEISIGLEFKFVLEFLSAFIKILQVAVNALSGLDGLTAV